MKLIIPLLVFSFALTIHDQNAEACRPADDRTDPPETIQEYDAARGLPNPTIVSAEFYRSSDNEGCAGESSCGTLRGLRIELTLPPGASNYILRVEDEHGHLEYAQLAANIYLFSYGGEEHLEAQELQISLVDQDGYPSEAVTVVALGEPAEDAGCSTSSRLPSSSSVLLALLAFWSIRRVLREGERPSAA